VLAEGVRTRIWYEAPGETSSIELFRNYAADLQAQGFSLIYDSSKDPKAGRWIGYLIPYGFGHSKLSTTRSDFVMYAAPNKTLYTLTAKREKDGQTTYVHLTSVQWDQDNRIYKAKRGA
jgi:OmpA-OmpF porin, OOP family